MNAKVPKADVYGCVLVNAKGEVLLREPTGHLGEHVWSFAEGKPDECENADQAAIRIAREGTGYRALIITPIPMFFGEQGVVTLVNDQMMLPDIATPKTAFYLMEPTGRQRKFEKETASTRWVDFEKALNLISQSRSDVGRERNLAVLRSAREAFEQVPSGDRPGTCKEDWKTRPMPKHRTKIALDIPYDRVAMMRIQKGFLPKEMEDKWFAWFEEPVLHLHRSWTGYCVYEVNFVSDGDGWRANYALVNRNSKQYTCGDDEWERHMIFDLIDGLLIQVN